MRMFHGLLWMWLIPLVAVDAVGAVVVVVGAGLRLLWMWLVPRAVAVHTVAAAVGASCG